MKYKLHLYCTGGQWELWNEHKFNEWIVVFQEFEEAERFMLLLLKDDI